MGALAQKEKAKREPTELEAVNTELRNAKANRRQLDKHIAGLERQRNILRRSREVQDLDPHAQAGPANVELMRDVFRDLRKATAAEATAEAGYPAGHQVWAIRALVKEGVIEETGFKVGVSKEYRWVGRRRKQTRMRPGS